MAAARNEEKGLLGSSSYRSHRRYGSTTVNMKKPDYVIRHRVSKHDTMQGIALRYEVTMECVKQHNRLWSSEAMFLHDYLEVPVTKEVFESHTVASCPSTPLVNDRVGTPDLRGGSEGSSNGDASSQQSSLAPPSSATSSPGPSSPAASLSSLAHTPTHDYSDTRPCDFLSKIDANIACMRSSILKFDSHKYPAIDQMELDDSGMGTTNTCHRSNANGFPVKNGTIITGRSSRFVNNGSATHNSGGGYGGCFSINGGFVADDEGSTPTVAVVGGSHQKHNRQPVTVVDSVRPSATRTITMSLKRLLREQDDFCPL